MSRLRRLEEFRYVGVRDTMRVYDTDDPEEAGQLEQRIADDDLLRAKLIQTFGPDDVEEAKNRGFRRI